MLLGVSNSFWSQMLVKIRASFHIVAPRQSGFQMQWALNIPVETKTLLQAVYISYQQKASLVHVRFPFVHSSAPSCSLFMAHTYSTCISVQCVHGLMFPVESNTHSLKQCSSFNMSFSKKPKERHIVLLILLGSALNHGEKNLSIRKQRDWGWAWADRMEEKEGSICISGTIKWYQWEAGSTDYLVVGRGGRVLW